MSLPTDPFRAVPLLLLTAPESDLSAFLMEADALIRFCPALLGLVDADLDAHGCRKKETREADARWIAEKNMRLRGMEPNDAEIRAKPAVLQQGRPRTPAYAVLMAVLLRGYFGAGFKARPVESSMTESVTFLLLLRNLGIRMPGQSTLTELANAVSNSTRQRILDAQAAQVLHLGLDDFTTMLQDSTHVEGNTQWPTDSRLMVSLAARLLRFGASLPRLQLPVVDAPSARTALNEMVALDREIDMSHGKKDGARARRRRYEKLLRRARRVRRQLAPQVAALAGHIEALDVRPSRRLAAQQAAWLMQNDLDALATVIENCEARVLHEQKVPMSQKVLSISDPDAGFIAKGQREPVIGYKPQLARSGNGFITGLLLPRGNGADSMVLVPMADEVMRRTGVKLKVLSVDDGYASAENVLEIKARGIEVTSINGAKGKALTAKADWDSDAYRDARNQRSAAESLMFTLKQGFHFGEVARRGLQAAHAEMLEKAIAYNICHLTRVRLAAAEAARKTAATAAEQSETAPSLAA